MRPMKIQLLSDLHIEFQSYQYPDCDSDIVVLAGDIHTKDQGVKWAIKNILDKPVVYILGNHEYYGKTYPKLVTEVKELARGTNIHILEQDVVTINGINFIGCTLWTDFDLFGSARIAGYYCQTKMTDYKKIKRLPNYSKVRSIDIAIAHKKSKFWLAEELKKRASETNIVVTHHGPSLKSVPPGSHKDMITAAYVSDLEDFIELYQPQLWLHGHLHNSSDYTIGRCRVLCNPKGYAGKENISFQPYRCFVV